MFFTSKFKRELKNKSTEDLFLMLDSLKVELQSFAEMASNLQQTSANTIPSSNSQLTKSSTNFALSEIASSISKTKKQIKLCKSELNSRHITLANEELLFD